MVTIDAKSIRFNFFIGIILQFLGLAVIWILLAVVIPSAREACGQNELICGNWNILMLLFSVALVTINFFAFFKFLSIPNNSLPPEKFLGIVSGISGLVAGLVLLLAVSTGKIL